MKGKSVLYDSLEQGLLKLVIRNETPSSKTNLEHALGVCSVDELGFSQL